MNKYKITQIICYFIVGLVFLGLGIWFMNRIGPHIGSGFRIENLRGTFNEVGSYDLSITDIKDIDIDWISGGVSVTPYDGTVIKLVEYAQRDLKEDEVLTYEVEGSKLIVKFYDKSTGLHLFMPSKKLQVMVPESLANNLEDFLLNNVSSEIEVSNITAKTVKIDSISGSIDMTDIYSDSIKLETTSGKILLTNSEATESSLESISGSVNINNVISKDQMSVDTTSGSISLEAVTSDNLSLETISGRVTADGNFENIIGGSTSGAFKIEDGVAPKSFNIHSISGSVTIAMPSLESMELKHSSVSGKFSCDFPIVENGGGGDYKISTTSGSIRVEKLN